MEALPLAFPLTPVHVTHRHILRRVGIGVCIVAVSALAIALIQPVPHLQSLNSQGMQPLDKPVVLQFQWPVARTADVRISPALEGQVSYEGTLVKNRLARTLTFTPSSTWLPGQTYTLTVSNVESAVGFRTRQSDYTFTFTTSPAPLVSTISPPVTNAIAADGAWTVTFNQPLTDAFAVSAHTDPPSDLQVIRSADGRSIILQPGQLLGQGKQYALTVERVARQFVFGSTEVAHEEAPQEIVSGMWFVREPPGIRSISPTGVGVVLDAPITVAFTDPVEVSAVERSASLSPSVVGAWSAVDAHTVRFTPTENLVRATTYTLTLAAGLRTATSGVLDADVRMQFRTQEPLGFAEVSPTHGSTGIDVARKIRVTFNQLVDHAEALQRVRLTPKVEGTWAWVDDELTFTPKGRYAFGTAYTVTVPKDLTVPNGFPAAADLALRFTTEQASTRLAVPFHRQEHKLSCEIATLVMALRYRGVEVTEQTIIDAIGFDPTPKKSGVWGDPDVAFVGNIDGQQPGTGYGVYAAPIAKAGSTYRPSRVMTGASLQDVLTEVQAGNPVIVWGNASTGQRVDWKTPTGKTVRAIVGEHTRVVVGFLGSVTSPSTIVTLDPLFGEKRFTRAAFVADWALLGNMAVVVE